MKEMRLLTCIPCGCGFLVDIGQEEYLGRAVDAKSLPDFVVTPGLPLAPAASSLISNSATIKFEQLMEMKRYDLYKERVQAYSPDAGVEEGGEVPPEVTVAGGGAEDEPLRLPAAARIDIAPDAFVMPLR